MPAANSHPDILESTEAQRVASGFIFTEGPLWHPDDFWYFVDIRQTSRTMHRRSHAITLAARSAVNFRAS